jgi:hypothetical protein
LPRSNKEMKNRLIVLMLLVGFLVGYADAQSSSGSNKLAPEAIWGKIENGVYENKLFGFRLKVPSDGVVLNRKEAEVFRDAGADSMKNISPDLDRKIEEELKKESVLFNYSTKPLGTSDNAVLIISVLKEPSNATASGVLAETLKELKMTGKYELTGSSNSMSLGQRSFYEIQGTYAVNGQKVKQNFMTTMVHGYALCIGVTFTSDKELKKIESILAGLEFFNK